MCRCSTKKRPAQRCAAPVLSVIKYWDYSAQSSFYTDILVPFFNHRYEVGGCVLSGCLLIALLQASMQVECVLQPLRRLWNVTGAHTAR